LEGERGRFVANRDCMVLAAVLVVEVVVVGRFEADELGTMGGRVHFLFLGLSDSNLVLYEFRVCSSGIRL